MLPSDPPAAARAAPAYTPDSDNRRATPRDDDTPTADDLGGAARVIGWAWKHRIVHGAALLVLSGSPAQWLARLTGHTSPGSARDSVQDARLAVFDTAYVRSLAERAALRSAVSELRGVVEVRSADLARGICAGQTAAQRRAGKLPCGALLEDGAPQWTLPLTPTLPPNAFPATLHTASTPEIGR